jgi:hypothetical protein
MQVKPGDSAKLCRNGTKITKWNTVVRSTLHAPNLSKPYIHVQNLCKKNLVWGMKRHWHINLEFIVMFLGKLVISKLKNL